MTPEQYVQDKAARSGRASTTRSCSWSLPRRAAITAFYAFCREIDDVVDEVGDPSVAAAKLAWWRSEVEAAFAGRPSHPALQALMPHAPAYGITPAHLGAVIDGCQMDLDQTRYLDFPALATYCHRVAGIVGEVSANIFGRTEEGHRRLRAPARPGDAADQHHPRRRRRRTPPRLPAGVGTAAVRRRAHELLRGSAPYAYGERFDALMRFQAERAHRCYDEALAFCPLPTGRRKPG